MQSGIIFLALVIACALDPEKELSTTQDDVAPAGGNIVRDANADTQKYEATEVLLRKIFDEICQTEKNYVNLIALFIEAYKDPLATYTVDAVKAEEDELFLNIKSIFEYNSTKFLSSLITEWEKEKEMAPIVFIEAVCKAFSSIHKGNEYENLYSRYAHKYLTASALSRTQKWVAYFNFLRKNKEKWRQVEKKEAEMNKADTCVQDYLITPVQQGPRYTLLLKEFIKNADPYKRKKDVSEEDLELHDVLQETLKVVAAVTKASNQKIPLFDVFSEKEINEMGKFLYSQRVEFSRRIKFNFNDAQAKHPAEFYVLENALVFIKADKESKARHYHLPVAQINYGELKDALVLAHSSGWTTHIYNITAPYGMKSEAWNHKMKEIIESFQKTVPPVLNEAPSQTLQRQSKVFKFHTNQSETTKNPKIRKFIHV